jgi:hypothetical protein
MRKNRYSVADIAAKVGAGDVNAQSQLRDQIASQMAFIVRRVLQTGKAVSPLDRRILAESSRFGTLDLEQRIRAIAQALSATVLTNLRAVPIQGRAANETIVDFSSATA